MSSYLSLSRQDTSAMKGIAILAMLFHHVYGSPPPGVEAYGGILHVIGTLGKVCVTLFIFCSGYGLAAQYEPRNTILDDIRFVMRRLTKFYLNYWSVFVIFVPVSVLLFHRPLSAAYGTGDIPHLLLDLLGIQGHHSYNITWWFNRLIIILYLLFPLLYRIVRLKPWVVLLLSMALMTQFNPSSIYAWQFTFCLGIAWRCCETDRVGIQRWMREHQNVSAGLVLCLLGCTIILRLSPEVGYIGGERADAFFTCAIALCVVTLFRRQGVTMKALCFFGKHSTNIYLTHTFLNSYWLKDWLHTCHGSGACGWWLCGGNIIMLTACCIMISIMLEYLKQKAGIYKLANHICGKI